MLARNRGVHGYILQAHFCCARPLLRAPYGGHHLGDRSRLRLGSRLLVARRRARRQQLRRVAGEEVAPEQYLPADARGTESLKATLQIRSDEEWAASFMNNWDVSNFHIYLFRWAHL